MANENLTPEIDPMDQPLPFWTMALLPVYVLVVIGIFIFPIAGDWTWLEGWIFVVPLTLSISIGYWIINQRNPRLIRNRAKTRKEGLTAATRESAGSDRWIVPIMGITFFGAMILPAVGHRLGWAALPLWVAILGAVLVNVGAWVMNMAMLENAYASKLLDINKDQFLIDTGPYGRVRHPLYTGGILMMLGVPIALGSLVSLVLGTIASLMLVIRIRFEEEMLVQGMDGYEAYQQRVKYRLIPGIY